MTYGDSKLNGAIMEIVEDMLNSKGYYNDANFLFALDKQASVHDKFKLIIEIEEVLAGVIDHEKAEYTMNQLYKYNSMNPKQLEHHLIMNKVKVSEVYSANEILKNQSAGSNIYETRQKSRELYSAIIKLVYAKNPERYESIAEIEAAIRYFETISFFYSFRRIVNESHVDPTMLYKAFLVGLWTTYSKMVGQLGEEKIANYLHSIVSRKHKKKSLDDFSEEIELARSAWDAGCRLTHDQMAILLGEVMTEADYVCLKREMKKVAPSDKVFGGSLCKRKELKECPCPDSISSSCSINKLNTKNKPISVNLRRK